MEKRPLDNKGAAQTSERDGKRERVTEESEDAKTLPTHTKIDAGGDLTLCAGEETGESQNFQVDSRTLCRISPAFNRMLLGPWSESKPTDDEKDWRVSLPEDLPGPLAVILKIIHSRFNHLPANLNFHELDDLLVVMDKYLISLSLIEPWVQQWSQCLHVPGLGLDRYRDRITILGLAWKLNDRTAFLTHVRQLTLWVASDANIEYLKLSEALQDVGPPDLVKKMAKHRMDMIRELVQFWQEELEWRTKTNFHCSRSSCLLLQRQKLPKNRTLLEAEEQKIRDCDNRIRKGLELAMEQLTDVTGEAASWWTPGALIQALEGGPANAKSCLYPPDIDSRLGHPGCLNRTRDRYRALQSKTMTDIERFADIWDTDTRHGREKGTC